jgi:hypothetical protein
MKQVVIAILATLLASVAIYQSAEDNSNLKIEAEPFDYINFKADCTTALEVECAIDIERTVVACAKAF